MLQNLNATKERLQILSKQYEKLEAKSKADIKVLAKEVKSLRNSQSELKKELSVSVKEKCEAEVGYQPAHVISSRMFFLLTVHIFINFLSRKFAFSLCFS